MLTSARGEFFLTDRKTPRSQVLALRGSRKGEEEHTQQTHIGGPCPGGADTSQKHVRGEGGSRENQGEKECWEGDRREFCYILLCFINPIWGNRSGPGIVNGLVGPQMITWGGWFLTLHLNYIAGSTGSLSSGSLSSDSLSSFGFWFVTPPHN